ncbi:MAG: hypothetical protein K1000chlam3_01598 [Chlamydiae bacterium]|nr:hypothetical protein [Chlamydiota bacterium]
MASLIRGANSQEAYIRLCMAEEMQFLVELRAWFEREKDSSSFKEEWLNKFNTLHPKYKEALIGNSSEKKVCSLKKIEKTFDNLNAIIEKPEIVFLEEFQKVLRKVKTLDFIPAINAWNRDEESPKERAWVDLTEQCPELKRFMTAWYLNKKKNEDSNGKNDQKWFEEDSFLVAVQFKKLLGLFNPTLLERFVDQI